MKVSGTTWSRANVLTLIGVIAGILIIPAVAILTPGELTSGSQDFSKAVASDLDPHEATCLDDSNQVIPAGVAVCATLTGTWLGGSGPIGPGNRAMIAIWTRQAHPPFLVLTSPHAYQHSDRLQESIEYVVCVQPPPGAERTKSLADRMRIEVARGSSSGCPNSAAQP
jgi:hypothetical protein